MIRYNTRNLTKRDTLKLLITLLLLTYTLFANEVRTLSWPKGDSFLNFLENNQMPLKLYFDKDDEDKELLAEIMAGISYSVMYNDNNEVKQVLIPVSEELQIHIKKTKDDYLLTKNWNTFCVVPIDEFLQTFYKQAFLQIPLFPTHASAPLKKMIDFDLLNKYQNLEDLKMAFQRVDKRLSERLKQRDQVIHYYERVCEHIDDIEEDFLLFFPQVSKEVKKSMNQKRLEHWR